MSLEDILKSLVGLKLTGSTRAANMECFKFGELTKVGKNIYGKYALHIQCPWRIVNSKKILIASDDLFEQPGDLTEYDPDFEWDMPNGNDRDQKLKLFFEKNTPKVKKTELSQFGDLIIIFENEMELILFPSLSKQSEYSEFWRIFESNNEDSKHFVYSAMGLEIE